MSFLRTIVHEYSWIHLGIGLTGNGFFIIGSILFLPEWAETRSPLFHGLARWQTVGVWMFILGSALMFVGSLGELLVSLYSRRKNRKKTRTS